ncbi:MAG: class I SAM-dependent methyltransferase [Gemmatimonadales bacterium]|nr:class I SAM-dependent methyltransferase [Gemmatimonadales bacterium]
MLPSFDRRPGPPSVWLASHTWLLQPGMTVLDVASGAGRHALAAARLGCVVTAIDRDREALDIGRATAEEEGLDLRFVEADLEQPWPDLGTFDAILCFNYLDRARFPELVRRLAPRGVLVLETFLSSQRSLGWGPTRSEHLIEPGELAALVSPLRLLHGREVLEPLGGDRWRWVGSAVAQRVA